MAAALVQEGQVVQKAERTTLNPEQDVNKAEFYRNLSAVHARAYATTAVADMLQFIIGDDPNREDLADNMDFLNQKADDEIHGAGAKDEGSDALNMMFASITTLAFSKVMSDIIAMADETKENIGEAALVELDGSEQK